MITVYSKSLFIMLVITGLLTLHCHYCWVAMVMFMLADFTRSNGILLAGYLIWYHWLKLLSTNSILMILNTSTITCTRYCSDEQFVLFQSVAYQLFCHDIHTP